MKIFFTENKNVYSNSMLKFIIMKIKGILEQLKPEVFRATNDDQKNDIIKNLLLA
jgi:hypothetical protein